jgi:Uma2 family endonuclease
MKTQRKKGKSLTQRRRDAKKTMYNVVDGLKGLAMVFKVKFTLAEFEAIVALPENRERLLELIHGRIIEKVPTEFHGVIAGNALYYLKGFTRANGIKAYIGPEIRYQMPGDDDNSRLPDVSVRLADGQIVRQGAVERMPDLAIEIQSPDDSPEALRDRMEYYLRNGTRLGWILYSKTRTAEACTLDQADRMHIEALGSDESLTGGDVLPGFSVKVSELFVEE